MDFSGTTLLNYQQDGVKILTGMLREHGAAYLSDPPGAGKSPQALKTAEALGVSSLLIVCPASLRENWRREAARWLPQVVPTIVSYGETWRRPPPGRFDLAIFDESHALRSPKAKQTKACLKDIWPRCTYRLALSGTPLPNGRAVEAWPLFSRLWPERFGKWREYAERYCVKETPPWAQGRAIYKKCRNLEELGRLARERFLVRRPKEEILKELPPLVRQQIPLAVADDAGPCALADRLRALAVVEEGDAAGAMEFSTERRRLGILKVGAALEFITDLLESEECVVVFAHHKEVLAELRKGLGDANIPVAYLDGATPADRRMEAVDAFQQGRARVFLASILAAGVGLTLTRAGVVVMVEHDWLPATNIQAEARISRLTQMRICRAYYLAVPDSLDDAVTQAILRKQRDVNAVLAETGGFALDAAG